MICATTIENLKLGVKEFKIRTSGLLKIFYYELWWTFCSAVRFNLCNIWWNICAFFFELGLCGHKIYLFFALVVILLSGVEQLVQFS